MSTPALFSKLAFLSTPVAGQSLLAWIGFAAVWVWVFLALRVAKTVLARRMLSLSSRIGHEFWQDSGELIGRTNPLFLLVIGFYAGAQVLSLSPESRLSIGALLVVAFICQSGLWTDWIATLAITRMLHRGVGPDATTTATADALKFFARVAIWSLVLLLILSNLRVNITTLIAGLGVTGVAVALAVNQILGDFFASMAILLDKPFDVGHFISFDSFSGTVERIGFKTTRMRSITGEELVVGNANLLQSRIRNYRRLRERRVLFVVSIKDDTPMEKLATVPQMIRDIVGSVPKTRFERVHFREYANAAVNYEVVYHVVDQDLITYMDVQQRIGMDLLQRFRDHGVDLSAITQPQM
jgi:small-conductance mechanosensitive channel